MSSTYDALILLGLLVFSALFSGAEIAMMSISTAKVRELKEANVRGAKVLDKLKSNTHRLLITILIGNNLVNIGASVFSTVVFTKIFGDSGLGIATGVMTLMVLIFGEITPKTLAHKYRVKFALWMARPLWICQKLFFPMVVALDAIILRLTPKGSGGRDVISEGELREMINLSVEEGTLNLEESELIENVLEFSDISVSDVMTPRVKIDALDEKTNLKDAARYIVEHTHTRIPVFRKNIDNVIGMISVKDVLRYLHKGDIQNTLRDLDLRKVLNVPYTYKINRLFKQFQKKNIHLAIVRDEFGGVLGLVTMEDLLEEIVGEIVDESDREPEWILAKGKDWVRVQGGTPVEVIVGHFDEGFPGDEHDPLSVAILEKLHRFPQPDEEVIMGPYSLKIVKMKENAIEEVKVTLIPEEDRLEAIEKTED